MIKKLFKLNRAYRDAKEQAVEQTVNVLEARTNPFVSAFCIALLGLIWLGAILTPVGPLELYGAYGFAPVAVVS